MHMFVVICFIHNYNIKINAHNYVAHTALSVRCISVQVTLTMNCQQYMNAT